jgi:hypothetical protein
MAKRLKRGDPNRHKVVLHEVLTDTYIGTGFYVEEGDYVGVTFDPAEQTVTIRLSKTGNKPPVKPDVRHKRYRK